MTSLPTPTRDAIAMNMAAEELKSARSKHGRFNSSHEAYAVILEELDEFWDEVKKKKEVRDKKSMAKELTQVAAMALRGLSDLYITDV